MSQHRSSQRYRRRLLPEEALLRERLQLLARRNPRYGYRRIHAILRREGWACNRKRGQRLWRDEGLRLPARTKKRRRGPRMPGHLTAQAPKMIRCDNGPEFISQSLRDWCRFNNAGTGYIEPGAPWQNPFVESFNGHLRRELLEMESFNSLFEAQLLLEDWRLQYNHYRPHQSLSYQTPAEYAHRWRTDNQPELS